MVGRAGAGALFDTDHPYSPRARHQLPHVVSVSARLCARIWHYADSSRNVDDGADVLGVLAPYFGNRADRTGDRPFLMLGYALLGIGMLTFSFADGLVIALIAMVLLGVADSMLLPILQSYVSEQSPPQLRGRSLVTMEYSWAISGIIMIPIVGWLISVGSWQMPFRLLGCRQFHGYRRFVVFPSP